MQILSRESVILKELELKLELKQSPGTTASKEVEIHYNTKYYKVKQLDITHRVAEWLATDGLRLQDVVVSCWLWRHLLVL